MSKDREPPKASEGFVPALRAAAVKGGVEEGGEKLAPRHPDKMLRPGRTGSGYRTKQF